MREKTPQDYANELLRMYKENAVPPQDTLSHGETPANAPTSVEEPNLADGAGGLVVNVTTLRRLYPVKNAEVTVFTGSHTAPTVIESGITDESGKSGIFELQAPPKAESQQVQNDGVLPYSSYSVSVRSDGYVEQIAVNIPIFSGVISVQNIDLIPIAAAGKHTQPQIIQENNGYDL